MQGSFWTSSLILAVLGCWVQIHSVHARLDLSSIDALDHNSDLLQNLITHVDQTVRGTIDQLTFSFSLDELKECYNSSVGQSDLNIFRDGTGEVIKGVLKKFAKNDKPSPERIKQAGRSFVELVELVHECMAKDSESRTKLGFTSRSLLTKEEKKPLKSSRHFLSLFTDDCGLSSLEISDDLPSTFDWRSFNLVTPVVDQGDCGSCYIFSSVAAAESNVLSKRYNFDGVNPIPHNHFRLSQQAVLNCMDDGCDGGYPEDTLQFLSDYGSVKSDGSEYDGKEHTCRKPFNNAFTISNPCGYAFSDDDDYNTDELFMTAVLKYGPVVVAIHATHKLDYLKDYFPSEWKCGTDTDHAVLMVGWTKHHWIIKNSWGEDWGVDGYLYLPKGKNECGVNSEINFIRD